MTYTKSIKKLRLVLIASAILPILINHNSFAYNKTFFELNDILYYSPEAKDSCQSSSVDFKVEGKDNIERMWNFFIEKGLSPEQAAGILGNIKEESGFSPGRQENSQTFPNGGWGIVQWTGGRRLEIVKFIKSKDPDLMNTYYKPEYGHAVAEKDGYVPKDMPVEKNNLLLSYQLDFLYNESMSRNFTSSSSNERQTSIKNRFSGKKEWDAIKSASNVEEASDIWLFSFEKPKDQSVAHATKRADSGKSILEKMKSAGLGPGKPSDKVSVSQQAPELGSVPISERKAKLESTGLIVKSSYYGGKWMNNDGWYSTNKNQGIAPGSGGSDDPGIGNKNNVLAGKAWFAELSNPGTQDFKALGGLPNNTKLQVTYQGKTIVVEKGDVGTGNKKDLKGVDLWWEAAALLNYKGAGDLFIKIVDSNTPTTPVPKSKNMGGYYKIDAADGGKAGTAPSTSNDCVDTSSPGSVDALKSLTKAYALPDFKGKGYTGASKAMPAYVEAADKARKEGRYLGTGGSPTYADCGGFVTTLVIDSGWDNKYNYGGKGKAGPTGTQKIWLTENWKSLGKANVMDTSTLKSGDVFIEDGHTFIFVGDIPGFNSKIASASMNDRVPMAGSEKLTGRPGRGGEWFRKG